MLLALGRFRISSGTLWHIHSLMHGFVVVIIHIAVNIQVKHLGSSRFIMNFNHTVINGHELVGLFECRELLCHLSLRLIKENRYNDIYFLWAHGDDNSDIRTSNQIMKCFIHWKI